MPRHFVVSTAFALLASLSFAQAQHNQPVSHFSWHNVPTDVRAVAVANIVTMCTDPLGTGLVSLAAGFHHDPRGAAAAQPIPCDPAQPGISQELGGGTLPQDFFKPHGSKGGGSRGSGRNGNQASAFMSAPEPGFWEVEEGPTAAVEPDGVPVSITPTVDTPEPGTLVFGGVGLVCLIVRRRTRANRSSAPQGRIA